MPSLEEARKDYKTNFMTVKGVLGVCTSTYWTPTTPPDQMQPPTLKIYVADTKVIKHLPDTYEGYKCDYVVAPDGINPACD